MASKTADILIVDDESDIRALIQGILEDEGYSTRQAGNAKHAYEKLSERVPDLVILDIWLQYSEHDGLKILENIKAKNPLLPVIMISGHGTIETAVTAIRNGAYDFIEKPFKTDRLILMAERALESASLKRENEALRRKTQGPSDIVGASSVMSSIRSTLGRVAQTSSRVLLTGAPGTGKDVAARMIHRLSQRTDKAFVVVNCATMLPERLEMELFGNESGIMGESARAGVLEQANGGTLFLDEVADMPLETQAKIVRVLQEQKFLRLGGKDMIETDVRIVASSNRDLEEAVAQGRFRQDLFYRLNVVPVDMPTLRQHPEDIPALIDHFVEQYSKQSGLPPLSFSEGALAILQACDWPGNVRQLRNVIERIMIMGAGNLRDGIVLSEHLPAEVFPVKVGAAPQGAGESGANFMSVPLREAREIFEREYLTSQLRRFGGNISKTAQFVGMERAALHRKLKQLGISTGAKQNDDESGSEDDQALRIIA
ncbi:MAG: sigma-54-dependent Fis family transcriptional regulator [Micavibrio aeruginosavorus]|uniref:Sigma-54-dependent Fis family transcriptional regulator n=1 Tax=Micavibrio aeruginosavorus TaxID=349221 RepID=A0A7T5R0R9_9BACT|nr:MAG: sigma-54-dependent Fis family transcriptional regulator [Micavibrio aeruginosavorus]